MYVRVGGAQSMRDAIISGIRRTRAGEGTEGRAWRCAHPHAYPRVPRSWSNDWRPERTPRLVHIGKRDCDLVPDGFPYDYPYLGRFPHQYGTSSTSMIDYSYSARTSAKQGLSHLYGHGDPRPVHTRLYEYRTSACEDHPWCFGCLTWLYHVDKGSWN